MPLDILASALGRVPKARPTVEPSAGRAAVALVFRPGPDLLFIRRSEREGDPWSGHMAFPGGRVDAVDADDRATAERETWEEVGLDLARHGRLLGALDPLVTPRAASRRQLVVCPFVYALSADPLLRVNDEVAAVHWFSFDRLLAGEGRTTRTWTWMEQSMVLPSVHLDGIEVWGLTLRMLDDLIDIVAHDAQAREG